MDFLCTNKMAMNYVLYNKLSLTTQTFKSFSVNFFPKLYKTQSMISALTNPKKSARDHIQNILQFLRLTTLSQDEIVKEVIPSKVLQANEVLELLEAVDNNKPWLVTGFCKTQTVREISDTSERSEQSMNDSTGKLTTNLKDARLFTKPCTFEATYLTYRLREVTEYQSISNFTLQTLKDVEITSFVFQSKSISKLGNQPVYKLSCTIAIRRIVDGFCKETHIVQVGGSVVGSSEIEFPLKFRSGESLILEAQAWYNVALEFSTPHPAFSLYRKEEDITLLPWVTGGLYHICVQYYTPLHVRKIHYKIRAEPEVDSDN